MSKFREVKLPKNINQKIKSVEIRSNIFGFLYVKVKYYLEEEKKKK